MKHSKQYLYVAQYLESGRVFYYAELEDNYWTEERNLAKRFSKPDKNLVSIHVRSILNNAVKGFVLDNDPYEK